MKRLFCLIIVIVICIIPMLAYANAGIEAQEVIRQAITYMDEGKWDQYASLWTESNKRTLQNFFEDNNGTNSGVLTVESAELIEIIPLDDSMISQFDLQHIIEKDFKTYTYIVAIKIHTYQETDYYFNGVNFFLTTVAKENGKWCIVEDRIAPTGVFLEESASKDGNNILNSDRLDEMAKANNKRMTILNSRGDQAARSNGIVMPTWVRIYRRESGQTQQINLKSYSATVLASEWYSSWPTQSLYAGAVAVKQFAIYHVIYPKHPQLNADLCDRMTGESCCQKYDTSKSSTATTNAVNARWNDLLLSSAGSLFETQYSRGEESIAYQNSGKMRQKGTKYWADQGRDWRYMCEYYYNNSDKSSGAISFAYGIGY